MNKQKVAIYYRVSTDQQDFDSQESTVLSRIRHEQYEDVVVFKDFDVSANKVDLRDRPAMQLLLQAVKRGEIKKVFVYGRDRLARDPYEWDEIRRTLVENNVEVHFTQNSATQLQSEPVEILLGYMGYLEGQSIRKRIQDARRNYPTSLYGYVRVDRKHYEIDSLKASEVQKMFMGFSQTDNFDQMISTIKEFSKRLKRQDNRIIEMLRTAFYAGLVEREGKYFPIDHAPAIVQPQVFHSVQKKLETLELELATLKLNSPPLIITPTCGLCGGSMKVEHHVLPNELFTCANRHKKVEVSTRDLNTQLVGLLTNKLQNLNVELLHHDVQRFVQKFKRLAVRETNELQEEIQLNMEQVLAYNFPGDGSESLRDKFGYINELATRQKQINSLHEKLKVSLNNVYLITKMVSGELKKKLSNTEMLHVLARVLVREARVYLGHAEVDVLFNGYFIEDGV